MCVVLCCVGVCCVVLGFVVKHKQFCCVFGISGFTDFFFRTRIANKSRFFAAGWFGVVRYDILKASNKELLQYGVLI